MRCFRLCQALVVAHWSELAQHSVWIFNFTTNDLSFAIYRRHQVLRWVQTSTQNTLLMLIQRVRGSILDASIQIPHLNNRVHTHSYQPLVPRHHSRNLLIMSVETLNNRA
jgi:hypothetical protein